MHLQDNSATSIPMISLVCGRIFADYLVSSRSQAQGILTSRPMNCRQMPGASMLARIMHNTEIQASTTISSKQQNFLVCWTSSKTFYQSHQYQQVSLTPDTQALITSAVQITRHWSRAYKFLQQSFFAACLCTVDDILAPQALV